jgi:hypothetical protein
MTRAHTHRHTRKASTGGKMLRDHPLIPHAFSNGSRFSRRENFQSFLSFVKVSFVQKVFENKHLIKIIIIILIQKK